MIDSHEDDIFYDGFGMKIWEKRHCLVSEILQSSNTKTVQLFPYLLFFS